MSDGRAGVDLARLAGWMDGEGIGAGPITDVATLGGGTQNLILRFRRGGETYVLRRPPDAKREDSDETMRREARVLGALVDTDVPHPRLVGACGDATVLGAAFYLMDAVEGANPTVALPAPYRAWGSWRHRLGLSVADAAAAIGAVDPIAVGLAGFGRAEGFLERQVARWWSQLTSYVPYAGYPGPHLPHLGAVAAWLDDNRPRSWRPGLMHGDLHLANVLCAPDRPAVAAVVDWELSTIGDPLLDLGWLLATWPRDGEVPVANLAVEPAAGLPTPEELVARYAERSTRDLSALAWYEVLACYKLAAIIEGTYARACAGLAPWSTGLVLHDAAMRLMERAARRIAAS